MGLQLPVDHLQLGNVELAEMFPHLNICVLTCAYMCNTHCVCTWSHLKDVSESRHCLEHSWVGWSWRPAACTGQCRQSCRRSASWREVKGQVPWELVSYKYRNAGLLCHLVTVQCFVASHNTRFSCCLATTLALIATLFPAFFLLPSHRLTLLHLYPLPCYLATPLPCYLATMHSVHPYLAILYLVACWHPTCFQIHLAILLPWKLIPCGNCKLLLIPCIFAIQQTL